MNKRRIVGEEVDQHLLGDLGERVALDRVPDGEQIMAAAREDAVRFGMRAHPVGEEHRAELADDEVEARVLEGKLLRVGLPKAHRVRLDLLRRDVEHRLVEVGGDDLRVGQRIVERARDDAGSGGGFEDPCRPQIARARLASSSA